MEYLKVATELGDHYLSAVADAQEQFLKYMKLMVDSVSAPALLRQGTLPSPSEVLTANYEFAEKLLKTNQAPRVQFRPRATFTDPLRVDARTSGPPPLSVPETEPFVADAPSRVRPVT